MGYQPRKKSPRAAKFEYNKSLRGKVKNKDHENRRISRFAQEKKPVATAKEVSEGTLMRLHTLGKQKFGSSPFSEHFDRWLANVTSVLLEFESNPNIGVDDQFVKEREQIFAVIGQQLEERRRKEVALDEEFKNLSDYKNLLEQIKIEHATLMKEFKGRRNSEIRRLYSSINRLKREQDKIIRMKTGFFHGISKKSREQKESEVIQNLTVKQRELELAIMESKAAQEILRSEYERKRTPVVNSIKNVQKKAEDSETDDSLEDRWFTCEALINAVNTFLQRKALQNGKRKTEKVN